MVNIQKKESGVKFDEGKIRYDLIDAYSLEMLALVYTFGANKYSDNNWRKGFKWGRIFGAISRHIWAFWRGENDDPESKLPHLAHAAWGCFTLLNFNKFKIGEDERIKYEKSKEDF